ncbi:hypothetical protein L6452_18369 [Arctium lappa]|uniref:Uncharacterized protein n=1 Tax=Arctium lappa TaxID=4217 RepID=A0ACB9C655_ARCLA|nr:hypothetical protein L6452_18369 [Arctium lappa]
MLRVPRTIQRERRFHLPLSDLIPNKSSSLDVDSIFNASYNYKVGFLSFFISRFDSPSHHLRCIERRRLARALRLRDANHQNQEHPTDVQSLNLQSIDYRKRGDNTKTTALHRGRRKEYRGSKRNL